MEHPELRSGLNFRFADYTSTGQRVGLRKPTRSWKGVPGAIPVASAKPCYQQLSRTLAIALRLPGLRPFEDVSRANRVLSYFSLSRSNSASTVWWSGVVTSTFAVPDVNCSASNSRSTSAPPRPPRRL